MSPLQSGLKLLIRPMLTLAVCRWCADHSFAFATVRFVGFARAALRALPRLAAFPLRSLARLCTFDPFLRLAMIYPLVWLMLRNA
jgi:hypothetical protein